MYDFDFAVLRAINNHRIPALDPFLIAVTDSTFVIAMLIPTVLLLAGLITHRIVLRSMSYTLFLSYAIVTLIVNILKYSILRPRPFVDHAAIVRLSTVVTSSFPSGHTTDAFVMAFGLSMITRKNQFIIPVWIWAVMVAYTRMALGVHYPSDVLASVILSFFSAFAGRWLYGYFRKRSHRHDIMP